MRKVSLLRCLKRQCFLPKKLEWPEKTCTQFLEQSVRQGSDPMLVEPIKQPLIIIVSICFSSSWWSCWRYESKIWSTLAEDRDTYKNPALFRQRINLARYFACSTKIRSLFRPLEHCWRRIWNLEAAMAVTWSKYSSKYRYWRLRWLPRWRLSKRAYVTQHSHCVTLCKQAPRPLASSYSICMLFA